MIRLNSLTRIRLIRKPGALMIAAIGMMLFALHGNASVELVRNGEAVGVIVHNGHTEQPYRTHPTEDAYLHAPAEALQTYIQAMSGAELEQVASLEEAGNRPAIVLEIVDRVAGSSDADTGKEAYHIRTEGNRLILTAANQKALIHAAYGLLEDHLDCHFYNVNVTRHQGGVARFAGLRGKHIPERKTIVLADIDDFQEPSFANRGLVHQGGTDPMVIKNRAFGAWGRHPGGGMWANHNLYQLRPPEDRMRGDTVVAKGLFKDHPEIYPMNTEGEREPENWNMTLCGTSDSLPEILARAIIGDRPENYAGMVSAGQGDGFAPLPL